MGRYQWARRALLVWLLLHVHVGISRYVEARETSESEETVDEEQANAGGGMEGALGNVLQSLAPLASQLFAGGGGGAEDWLTTLGDKTKQTLAGFAVSDSARESIVVPFLEKLGALKDGLGMEFDFMKHAEQMSIQALSLHIPFMRFAAERLASHDREQDMKALDTIMAHSKARMAVRGYMRQEPERKMGQAPGALAVLSKEMREVQDAISQSIQAEVMPESLLVLFDSRAANFAKYVTAYLGTVARYLGMTDRFDRNKQALVVFSRIILPRLLHIMGIQIQVAKILWSAADAAESNNTDSWGPVEGSSVVGPSMDDASESGGGSIDAGMGLLLKVLSGPAKSHTYVRGYARRILVRVDRVLGSIKAISDGCLVACSLPFQIQFALALRDVREGEKHQIAFKACIKDVALISSGKAVPESVSEVLKGRNISTKTPQKPMSTVEMSQLTDAKDSRRNLHVPQMSTPQNISQALEEGMEKIVGASDGKSLAEQRDYDRAELLKLLHP